MMKMRSENNFQGQEKRYETVGNQDTEGDPREGRPLKLISILKVLIFLLRKHVFFQSFCPICKFYLYKIIRSCNSAALLGGLIPPPVPCFTYRIQFVSAANIFSFFFFLGLVTIQAGIITYRRSYFVPFSVLLTSPPPTFYKLRYFWGRNINGMKKTTNSKNIYSVYLFDFLKIK